VAAKGPLVTEGGHLLPQEDNKISQVKKFGLGDSQQKKKPTATLKGSGWSNISQRHKVYMVEKGEEWPLTFRDPRRGSVSWKNPVSGGAREIFERGKKKSDKT